MSQKEENWCGGKDSNLHGIATASPSSWCVCQFRHHRIKLNRCFCLLLSSGSPLEVTAAFSGFDCPANLRKSNQNCITHFARREFLLGSDYGFGFCEAGGVLPGVVAGAFCGVGAGVCGGAGCFVAGFALS